MNIYKITNIITGQIYVGKTNKCINERFKQHVSLGRKYKASLIQKSLREYGTINHTIELLEICSENDGFKREQYWIDSLNTLNNGLNIKNEFTLKKVATYYNCPELARENLNNKVIWNRGIPLTESAKQHLSIIKKERFKRGLYQKYGHKHTKDSRKKISDIKKNYYKNGGLNPQSKTYTVYDNSSKMIVDKMIRDKILSLLNLTYHNWCVIRTYCRKYNRIHPKFNILIIEDGYANRKNT